MGVSHGVKAKLGFTIIVNDKTVMSDQGLVRFLIRDSLMPSSIINVTVVNIAQVEQVCKCEKTAKYVVLKNICSCLLTSSQAYHTRHVAQIIASFHSNVVCGALDSV